MPQKVQPMARGPPERGELLGRTTVMVACGVAKRFCFIMRFDLIGPSLNPASWAMIAEYCRCRHILCWQRMLMSRQRYPFKSNCIQIADCKCRQGHIWKRCPTTHFGLLTRRKLVTFSEVTIFTKSTRSTCRKSIWRLLQRDGFHFKRCDL